MHGTDLTIITPAEPDVLGPGIDRAPEISTNASTDHELFIVWLKSHQDGSAHTLRAYNRAGRRFLAALDGKSIRSARVEDVQRALETLRTTEDGRAAKPATVNSYVAAVKSLLNFAHQVGYTRFNVAPVIKLKKAPRQLAQKLMSEVDVKLLIRAAKTSRDRLMLEVAYYGACGCQSWCRCGGGS